MAPLARRALAGVAWNWSGSGVLVVAQVASTAATARLVSPAEFGLYAAAQAVYGFAGFFCMRAAGQELQRRSSLDSRTAGTAFTVLMLASLAVAGAVALAAPLWADLWGVPGASPAIRVFALALLLHSAAAIPVSLLRRDLRFGRAAVVETGSLVVGMGAGVAFAAAMHSALALALGQALGALALVAGAGVAAGRGLRPSFERGDARAISTFAAQVGGLGLLSYCAGILPSLFVARQFGAYTLGLFSRARLMAELPADYAVTSIYKVIYPLYGKVREDVTRTRTLLRESLTLTTGLVWPVFALMAGAAPLVVHVVLGQRWDGSAPLLTFFALGACALVPTGLLSNCAEAFGWMRIIALRLAAFLTGVGVVIAIAAAAGLDAESLLAGVALVQWLTYLATLSPFVRRGLVEFRETAYQQGIHALLAAAAFLSGVLGARVADGAPVVIQLLALAAAALLPAGGAFMLRSVYPAATILTTRLGRSPTSGFGQPSATS